MIGIRGIGWITKNKFGSVFKKEITEYADKADVYSLFKKQSIIPESFRHFGRFDRVSKNTCLAISSGLFDADVYCSKETKPDLGILSTNSKGCLQSNINYFKDYIDCGRRLSRGNLFIFTLPSTPIAESAIIFGCQGPIAHLTFKDDQTPSILEHGRMMISQKEAKELLIVNANEEEAICFYIKEHAHAFENEYMSLEQLQESFTDTEELSEIILRISEKGTE
ncbi:MAG: hypothetical protein K8S27_15170 [Candidatus Omnitrophica bacterium]|nr:hypothetical protein [Candidatus Omnitrophota bacterium]